MAFRNLTCRLFQLVRHQTLHIPIQQQIFIRKPILHQSIYRTFTAVQTNGNAYKDLSLFLEKEIQLEKNAQKHPNGLPKIEGFEVQSKGPEVTLIRQTGNDKVTVKFNVINTVNTSDSDQDNVTGEQQNISETSQSSGQLKSRPTFTIDINRSGQILSFLCSYLPDDYSGMSIVDIQQSENENNQQTSEDFQIDEFAIHEGEWNEKTYSADCAVVDGALYDKLLNLLEEHGIGEDFANQLANFSTAYEHQQYINLLEKLQKFAKK